MPPCFVLTAAQRKGGVGRSTLLYNLAGALAKRALRVLIVDGDPQASVTQLCLGPESTDTIRPDRSIVRLLGDEFFGSAADVAVESGVPGVRLVPGSNALARFNHAEPEKTGDLQDALKAALDPVRPSYDAILCDTPPSLETLAWLPAVAADVAITPTPAAALAIQELAHTSRFIERVRWGKNPRLAWIGVVVTMWRPRVAVQEAYAGVLRETYGDLVMESPVPFAPIFEEMAMAGQPLSHWKPKSAGAKAIDALAGEILGRVAAVRGGAGEASAA
jgi:chromosome partitioning protein